MTVDAVAAGLEKSFGGWRDDTAGYAGEEPQPASFAAGQKVLLVPEPGASQSALYVARPAPGLDEARRNESVAVSRLLGGDFSSRLNSVIREEKGYSYGVDSYLLDAVRNGSALVVATTVERDNTGAAIAEILKGFQGMASIPVTAEEVNRTVTLYRQVLAGEAETSAGLFAELLAAVGAGSTLEENHKWREEKTRLALAGVAGQAVALSPLDPAIIVVAGDPEIVMPQLAAIGFKVVELVKREDVPQPTAVAADRALGLDGPVSSPVGLFGTEIGGRQDSATVAGPGGRRRAGTTETIHACEESGEVSEDCSAQMHAE